MKHLRIFYGFNEEEIRGLELKINTWLLKMGNMIEIIERKHAAFGTGINTLNCIAVAIYYKTNY